MPKNLHMHSTAGIRLITCHLRMQLPAAHAWRAWLAADRAQRDAPPDATVHALMTALSQAAAFVSRHG